MKRYHALSSITFILILLFAGSFTLSHAQQPTAVRSDQIPSDLSLDLQLAQQNSSPDRQALADSEIKQVKEITTAGQASVVIPEDTIDPEAKTESAEIALHPEQTSSEQVVEVPETVTVNESGTPIPTNGNQPTGIESENGATGEPSPTDNVVPGTNVVQPDDNAAPMDNSTDPNLPAPTSADNGISPTAGQGQQPSDQTPSGANTVQPTSDQTQPTAQPTSDTTAQPTADQSAPSDSTTSTTNDTTNTSGDGSVQGAATTASPDMLQAILQPIKSFFHSLSNFFMRK